MIEARALKLSRLVALALSYGKTAKAEFDVFLLENKKHTTRRANVKSK